MNHLRRRLTLGMTVGQGQITLHEQPVTVLHQSMPHEAQHGTRAGGFIV